ncbi:MAG: heterocyst frequency control protein PatD [Calothrix sp. C42_A2020_038]|nr:heterocyst frequency control protein PatD [Calothrix sp. C42_A2020_038]
MSLTQDKYNTFATQLTELRSLVNANQLTVTELSQRLVSLQQFFATQIVPLASDDSVEIKYRTETSKQLKLLEVDITFLRSARQPATIQTRLNMISERLATLTRYCEAVVRDEKQM